MTALLPRLARRLLPLALLALAAPALAQDLDVQEITLENGMKVLLYDRPGDPNVACGWIAHVGSVNEHPGITGLSHLFEHMMFKGTRVIGTKDFKSDAEINAEQDRVRAELRQEQDLLDWRQFRGEIPDASDPSARTPRHQQLLQQFDELVKRQKDLLIDNEFDALYQKAGGGGLNAFTSHDFTAYFVNLPANKLELWFWLESDRLVNPVFRQFYSERDVVWEERRMRTEATPTGKLDELFDAMFWNASPYSWPVIGWPSDLNGITREEANAYFASNYSPNNLTAALVGDFDLAEAERLARTYFSRIPRSPVPPTKVKTFEPPMIGTRRYEAEAETRPTVEMRWFAVPHLHADEQALTVLQDLLNGETGRLQMSLVKGSKIAASARAGLDARKYGGYFAASAVAAPGHETGEVEEALLAEITKLKEQLVPDAELQKIKNQALAGKFRRLDGNWLIMIQLLIYDAQDSWRNMTTETDKYLKVTAADVQRVAKKYLDFGTRTTAVYREKKSDAPPDPLWDAMSPEQQAQAQQMKAGLAMMTDPAQLEGILAQVGAKKASAPPEEKPVIAWLEKFLQDRIATLKGGAQ